jgi:hypothetical protein
MDPNELIRYGADVAKAGAMVAGAAIPFTGIVKSILGPAAEEIAERIRDEVRLYRFSKQVRLLKKAEAIAKAAGFVPKAVPIKVLFPLLEGASLEDHEDLQDMWAALLANASNHVTADLVRPSFSDLLKIMTSDMAKMLNVTFDHALEIVHPNTGARTEDLGIELEEAEVHETNSVIGEINDITLVDLGTYRKMYRLFRRSSGMAVPEAVLTGESDRLELEEDQLDRHRFAVVMDELQRMQMWSVSKSEHYYFTALAAQFVTVCRSPKATNK